MGLLQSSCLLPQSLWVGSVGLVIESFGTRWFTQATDLALGCFVDLLPFKRIANFHIHLTRMEEISPVFPVLLEFRCTCFLSNGYWYFAVITNGDQTCSSVITQQHLILSQCCPFCLWISFLAVCSPLTQQLVYHLTVFLPLLYLSPVALDCPVTLHIFQLLEFACLPDTSGINKVYQHISEPIAHLGFILD